MDDYNKIIDEYKKYLSKLSNQLVIDLKGILLDEIIEYELKRTNSDIVIYLFEYGYELFDLTFYGCDNKYESYLKHISLPTKFPNENHKCLTPKNLVLFEQERWVSICEGKLDSKEEKKFAEYQEQKQPIFESWFLSCWKTAKTGINYEKGIYYSMHDTGERIDLSTMETITDEEIKMKFRGK